MSASSKKAESGWNILVNIGADNALASLVPTLRETLAKVRTKPGVTLCVQETVATKGSTKPPVTTQYVLENGVRRNERTLGSVDTGSAATLTTFLDWGMSQAPTSKVALVLCSHGTGVGPDGSDAAKARRKKKRPRVPTSGVNYSDYFESALSMPCLAVAIEGSTNQRVDVVVFDACDMAELEMLYELQGVTDLIVASEDMVPVKTATGKQIPGMPYDVWISGLKAKTETKAVATTAVHDFVAHQKKSGNSASMAALDPTKTPTLATAVAALGTLMAPHLAVPTTKADIDAKRTASLGFTEDYFRDLSQVAKNLRKLEKTIPGIAAACNEVTSALKPVVIAVDSVPEGKNEPKGVSIVFQSAATPLISTYRPLAFTKKAGKGWYTFLRAYARKTPAKLTAQKA